MQTIRIFAAAMLLAACTFMEAQAQGTSVRGVIKDGETGLPVEFASVTMMTADSVFISGTTTKKNGGFVVYDTKERGTYMLKISCIGYNTLKTSLKGTGKDVSAGDIYLTAARTELDGITVTASGQTGFSDRKLLYPTSRQVKLSDNGVSLLREMMIPRIEVNSFRNTIATIDGGDVQLRINDAEATIQDIMALQPGEVKRIEYIDSPGMRYGNAEVVLNFIVRRRTSGGNFSSDIMQGVNALWGNYRVSGKVNMRKSELGISAFSGLSDTGSLRSNTTETFNLAGGKTLQRIETGIPSKIEQFNNQINTNYSYMPDDRSYFNVRFRMMFSNMPHMDNKSMVYNAANPEDFVYRTNMYHSGRIKPALDIYWQRTMPKDQTLAVNIVGTYQANKDNRLYIEETGDEVLTSNDNRVQGRRYTVSGEVIYEKKLARKQVLDFGVKHSHTFAENKHLMNGRKTDSRQGYTYLFGEYKKRAGKLDYTLGMGVTRSFHSNKGKEDETLYAVNPRLNIQYKISESSKIRFKGTAKNASPGYEDLDEVIQFVDSMQLKRGNAGLKSYMNYHTQLNYDWQKGIFYVGIGGTYDYEPDCIMDEKVLYGDKVMNTLDNQKSWQRLRGMATIKVGPIRDMLQMSLTGGAARYLSKGNNYSHGITSFFYNMSVSANYKNASLMWEMKNSVKSLRGETVSSYENFQALSAMYRYKNWMFGAMMFFPFDNLRQETEELNRHAAKKERIRLDAAHRLFILKATYNISFGKQTKSKNRRFEREEED